MFLRTVMCGHSAYDWNTMPMLRLSGGRLTCRAASNTVAVAERDRARARRLQPGEAAQRRGLAAPARTEEDEELALLDLEVEVVDAFVGGLPPKCLVSPVACTWDITLTSVP